MFICHLSGSSRTSMVLLLLVVVAEVSLTLCCHAPLSLNNLFCITGPRALEPLRGIETLEVRSRVRTKGVEVTHRMALGW